MFHPSKHKLTSKSIISSFPDNRCFIHVNTNWQANLFAFFFSDNTSALPNSYNRLPIMHFTWQCKGKCTTKYNNSKSSATNKILWLAFKQVIKSSILMLLWKNKDLRQDNISQSSANFNLCFVYTVSVHPENICLFNRNTSKMCHWHNLVSFYWLWTYFEPFPNVSIVYF